MGSFRSLSAMFILILFLLVLYAILHLEVTHSAPQDLFMLESSISPAPAVHAVSESQDTMYIDVQDVLVSEDFRRLIYQNEAYWNRLLFSALRSLDNKENPLKNKPPWLSCRQENQKLQLNVHDFYSYPALLQTFLQGMNCMSPPVLINQPSKCLPREDEDRRTFLLLTIKSTPRNFERRQAVRETWGREGVYENGLRVRTVFLLGNTSPDDPELGTLLSYEAKHFKDLVQWDFHDSFFNLTLKMSTFFRWTLKNCPQASFIFSGDDDVFVNTPLMLTYLHSLEASKAAHLYVGHVINSASPHRDPKNKYYVPKSFYDGVYPAYAGGGGFLFSGALLQPLYLLSHILPSYPIDDVYFGMLMKALGISPEAHPGFQTFDIRAEDRANACVHKSHILIHQRFPQEMKKMWNTIRSPLLTC